MRLTLFFSLLLITTSCSAKKNYMKIKALNEDGTYNAVIEIPAGTNEKWEVRKKTGHMVWDKKNGKKRLVNYLPYPANYGMIPSTHAGDGDPQDVMVLGTSRKRGSIIKVHLLGYLTAIDDGESDNKWLAVMDESELSGKERKRTNLHKVRTLDQLNREFPGITDIIKIFFTNYKRKKKDFSPKMVIKGWKSQTKI